MSWWQYSVCKAACVKKRERLVLYCRTTSASTAPRTHRRMCCPYAYVLITVLRVSQNEGHLALSEQNWARRTTISSAILHSTLCCNRSYSTCCSFVLDFMLFMLVCTRLHTLVIDSMPFSALCSYTRLNALLDCTLLFYGDRSFIADLHVDNTILQQPFQRRQMLNNVLRPRVMAARLHAWV